MACKATGEKLQCGGLQPLYEGLECDGSEGELNSLPECLLFSNLVVIEWMAAITGDHMGLSRDFSPTRKILENHFQRSRTGDSQYKCYHKN